MRLMEISPEEFIDFFWFLHPIALVVAWDIYRGTITEDTISLAASTEETKLWEQYDFLRCVGNANPDVPPVEEARGLLEELLEKRSVDVL